MCRLHSVHSGPLSTWHQLLLLAPLLNEPVVCLLHDRSHPPLLSARLPHQDLLAQVEGSSSPDAAVPVRVVRSAGPGSHLLQQAPERQRPLHLLARPAGPAHGGRGQSAVSGGRASHLPLSGQRLVAGQAQTLPRCHRTGVSPAGQRQPAAGPLHQLVHGGGGEIRLVPGGALPDACRPRSDEPSHQRLHGQKEVAILIWKERLGDAAAATEDKGLTNLAIVIIYALKGSGPLGPVLIGAKREHTLYETLFY